MDESLLSMSRGKQAYKILLQQQKHNKKKTATALRAFVAVAVTPACLDDIFLFGKKCMHKKCM